MGIATNTNTGAERLIVTIVTLGAAAGILIPLYFGGMKVLAGDYPPGVIMLLFAGFVLCVFAGWLMRRYQGPLFVLGISLLTLMGIIWAVFEDGFGPKAFMLSLVVTAGFMATLGFYNVFLKRWQPRMAG